MSDKNLNEDSEEKLFDAIPPESEISINVTGHYYINIKREFYNILMEDESEETIAKILDNLSNNKITSSKENRLRFYFDLMVVIEEAAIKQKVIVKKPMPKADSNI